MSILFDTVFAALLSGWKMSAFFKLLGMIFYQYLVHRARKTSRNDLISPLQNIPRQQFHLLDIVFSIIYYQSETQRTIFISS